MTSLNSESVIAPVILMEFAWGLLSPAYSINPNCYETASNKFYFARATNDISLDFVTEESAFAGSATASTQLYKSCPQIEFTMSAPQSTGIEDEPFRVILPHNTYPFNVFAWQIMPPTRIRIYEAFYKNPAWSRGVNAYPQVWGTYFEKNLIVDGYIARCTARYNKRPDIIAMECVRAKSQITGIPLGILTTERCHWIFGDQRCKKNVSALITSSTCTMISPRIIEITISNAGTFTNVNEVIVKGSVNYEGLTVPIVSAGSMGSNKYRLGLLFDAPSHPSYTWNGKSIFFKPGCAKSISACTAWNNQANYGGFGMLVPTYNPQFESGKSDV